MMLIVLYGIVAIAGTADWPQWRGPDRNGISKEAGLLQEWPAEGPKLLWQQTGLGDGYSTPAVVGDRIFLISNKGLDDEFVQCRSVSDGQQLWSTHIGKVGNPKQKPPYPGARSTPTVDGKLLYALGSDGDLACMDIAQGKIRWHKSLRTDFGGTPGTWGYAESPLVDGNVVVVTPGGKDATIVALNKMNGEIVQKYPVPEGDPAGYSSIIIVNAAAVRQYVQFLGKGLVGVDAKTGKFLWRYDHTTQHSPANIATPIAGDDCIYTGTHYTGGGLVRLSSNAGEIKADEVYFNKKLPTAIGGAVLLGEYMYGTNRELFLCVNFKTGEIKWQKGAPWRVVTLLCRWPALPARRNQWRRGPHRGLIGSLSRARSLHAAERPGKSPAKCQGLDIPGRRQWPPVYSRLGHALVLRREGPA